MPFLRLTRDRRGYENTFLLHAFQPGDRPRVLYWYRTAPGVRVGRAALDEDAIRTIEAQHPEIDFDWMHILEIGATAVTEVERRVPQPKKRGRGRDQAAAPPRVTQAPREADAVLEQALEAAATPAVREDVAEVPMETPLAPESDEEREEGPHAAGLLEELVGRGIATRLRARYAELSARIAERIADPVAREEFRKRAEALDPDTWVTPDEILRGVQRADRLFEELRAALPA